MYWIPALLVGFLYFLFELFTNRKWLLVLAVTGICLAVTGIVIAIDYGVRTADIEVWSGHITGWDHKEEYDEWIPPDTTCTTDSNGKKHCTTTPGYWKHHDAENYITTSDDGTFSVDRTPDGRIMDDSYPNTTEELKQIFPSNTPTASVHTYTNKVQASYSIYKHKEIDLKKYKDLPEYPDTVHYYYNVDRIIGNVPNKEAALQALASENSYLNRSVPDPEKPGETRSWKEVNLIFVNVGDKPEDYGFALQDKWEGGNKNDFVVAFSTKSDGTINWVYPFSWSEAEDLKLDVRDYMLNKKKITDFVPIVKDVGDMVAKKFVRKQFADFNYLQIEPSNGAVITIWILNFLLGIGAGFISFANSSSTKNKQNKHFLY